MEGSARTGCLMAVIPVGSQIFDLAFHPSSDVVYTGLLDGKVKAFTYDDQGTYSEAFSLRISKRSCRGLALSPDGSSLYAVGKNRSLQCVPTSSILVRSIDIWIVPLTRVRERCRTHARACTSECYGPAGAASMKPRIFPQRTYQSRRASYAAPPCDRRRRRYDQGERSNLMFIPPRGDKIQNATWGDWGFEAMGSTEAGCYTRVYATF